MSNTVYLLRVHDVVSNEQDIILGTENIDLAIFAAYSLLSGNGLTQAVKIETKEHIDYFGRNVFAFLVGGHSILSIVELKIDQQGMFETAYTFINNNFLVELYNEAEEARPQQTLLHLPNGNKNNQKRRRR